jgi:hypothetical protein
MAMTRVVAFLQFVWRIVRFLPFEAIYGRPTPSSERVYDLQSFDLPTVLHVL